jgi:hypothetical protein
MAKDIETSNRAMTAILCGRVESNRRCGIQLSFVSGQNPTCRYKRDISRLNAFSLLCNVKRRPNNKLFRILKYILERGTKKALFALPED